MRNEKCWTKKGDFDHFGCVLGVLATVFAILGTNEMHTLVIGQALTGLAAFR